MYTYCLFYADYLPHVYLLFTFYFVDSACHRRQVGRFPYVRRGTCGTDIPHVICITPRHYLGHGFTNSDGTWYWRIKLETVELTS